MGRRGVPEVSVATASTQATVRRPPPEGSVARLPAGSGKAPAKLHQTAFWQARIRQFKLAGKAVTLDEVPNVIGKLLPFNAVDLRALVKELGLSYAELQR